MREPVAPVEEDYPPDEGYDEEGPVGDGPIDDGPEEPPPDEEY